MLQLPSCLITHYCVHLNKRGIKNEYFDDYLKWLRFFLNFSEKYKVSGSEPYRLRLFVNKLKEKNQTGDQRRRAYHAVSLYFEMLKQEKKAITLNDPPQSSSMPVVHPYHQ